MTNTETRTTTERPTHSPPQVRAITERRPQEDDEPTRSGREPQPENIHPNRRKESEKHG